MGEKVHYLQVAIIGYNYHKQGKGYIAFGNDHVRRVYEQAKAILLKNASGGEEGERRREL